MAGRDVVTRLAGEDFDPEAVIAQGTTSMDKPDDRPRYRVPQRTGGNPMLKPRPMTPEQRSKMALEMARRYLQMDPAGQRVCLDRVKQENGPLYQMIISHLEKLGRRK